MATFTIRCGSAHKSRHPQRQTIGTFVGKIPTDGARRFSATKSKSRTVTVQVPAAAAAAAPQGAWSKGRFSLSNNRVTELRRSKPQRNTQTVAVECRYCHQDHNIRVCPKLAEKNRRRTQWAEKEAAEKKARKAQLALRKREMAEALLAERVRKAMEKKNPEPVEEDSDRESDYSDEEEEEQTLRRRVTFANDSDCLMKPEPTQIKEFDNTEPASAVSSDEEDTSAADADYFASKRSAGAWRPRSRSVSISEDPEVTALKKELADKEKELAGMGNDSWADACDIDDLEEEIAELKEKLGIPTEEEEEEPKMFQNMLTKIRRCESQWDDNEPSIFLA